MGIKRKQNASPSEPQEAQNKKHKPMPVGSENSKLLCAPRPDWHAAKLPPFPQDGASNRRPSQESINELQKYATSLLEAENTAYNTANSSKSSSHKFLSTIMSSGTLEDKISALTLLVQESPLHSMKAFENLVGLSSKKSRGQALMAVAALKDLLGQGVVLPGDRKLRAFAKQPSMVAALQGHKVGWTHGQMLPAGMQKIHLIVWAFEDWLKRKYFEILQVLEYWCSDEVEYARSRAVTYVWELLRDKPEQEENLLRLLVNKLGDTDRKIASRASYLLLQLETTHPAMNMVITDSIESECLFRPGQSLHAKYHAVITLNQTILSQKDEAVAHRLLDIYFSLFVQLLKPTTDERPFQKPLRNGKAQGGGGKAGKLAIKKQKAQERAEEADAQLQEKLVAQVLTGVNRAFPFADTSNPIFEKQLDTIFRVTHSANFNTAVQALVLLQQISSTKHYGAERFYRTLYESLLDPRLHSSSKQVIYLNLLYKSLKADVDAQRVQAFVKRLLQVVGIHEPPFACGILYLISQLESTFPGIRAMISDAEVNDEDEEEHFQDAPEDGQNVLAKTTSAQPPPRPRYDAKKRDPSHAHADRSALWDLLPSILHFHPSVSLFASSILQNLPMPPKPDPASHTLMHFLDRFVYRSPRSKPSAGMRGSSIMQPVAGSNAADLLVKPGKEGAYRDSINSDTFWQKKIEDVAADEVFFHAYFREGGGKRRRASNKLVQAVKDSEDRSGEEDEGEEEIWKAITASKPEVDALDAEDDDLSMGDLESGYSDSEADSEAGIDLGGGDQDGEDIEEGDGLVLDDGSDADDKDGMPEWDSEDDAMFDDEDDVPDQFGHLEAEPAAGEEMPRNKKKRQEKKKLKQLPTFASAEDYAKLLDNDDEDGL